MALTWDLTRTFDGMTDEQKKKWHEDYDGALDVMVFSAMFVGIGDLTEEVMPEFLARMKTLEAWGLSASTKPVPEEVVRAFIGMRCNVGLEPRMTWLATKFAKAFPDAGDDGMSCGPCGGRTCWEVRVADSRFNDTMLVRSCQTCDDVSESKTAMWARIPVVL